MARNQIFDISVLLKYAKIVDEAKKQAVSKKKRSEC